MIRRPKALLFDMGDTLLQMMEMDIERGVRRLFELAGNPRRLRPESMLAAVGKLQKDWQQRTESSLMEGSFQGMLRNAAGQLGLIFEHSMDDLERIFWDSAVRMTPTPGIEDLLAEAGERGLGRGVLSNSIFTEATLRHELRRHGLEDSFAFIMASADYGMRKPHPELFATAIGLLGGLPPADIWMLGDSLEADVAGGHAAGMQTVWYNPWEEPRSEATIDPTAQVTDWRQVQLLLEKYAVAL